MSPVVFYYKREGRDEEMESTLMRHLNAISKQADKMEASANSRNSTKQDKIRREADRLDTTGQARRQAHRSRVVNDLERSHGKNIDGDKVYALPDEMNSRQEMQMWTKEDKSDENSDEFELQPKEISKYKNALKISRKTSQWLIDMPDEMRNLLKIVLNHQNINNFYVKCFGFNLSGDGAIRIDIPENYNFNGDDEINQVWIRFRAATLILRTYKKSGQHGNDWNVIPNILEPTKNRMPDVMIPKINPK